MEIFNKIYSSDLHKSLTDGKLIGEDLYRQGGLHLVCFRVLKKDSKQIIYKSIYYPEIFVNSLLLYFVTKQSFINSQVFKDWGDFLTVIDSKFNNDEMSGIIFKNMIKRNLYYQEYLSQHDIILDNPLKILDLLKKLTILHSNINEAIYNIVVKNYHELLNEFVITEVNNAELNHIYLLRDCVFVVKDLDSVLNYFTNKDFVISKGVKSDRNLVDSCSHMLSLVDSDYRLFLQRVSDSKLKPVKLTLPRAKFSYKNVHMNIGNIRYYSTTSVRKNRQNFILDNYKEVNRMIENSYNVGSIELQKSIEEFLLNQESEYADLNIISKRLNFNKECMSYLESKIKDLGKLLDYKEFPTNSNYISTEVLPLVKEITDTLGTSKVVNILLSYFMEILSKETVSTEEGETPGISTIHAFNRLGKHMFNRFIFVKYSRSTLRTQGISLSNYIKSIENDYKYFTDLNRSYATLGGYFVWNLITVNMLTEVLEHDLDEENKTVHYLRIPNNVRSIFIKEKVKMFHTPQKLPMVCEPKDYVLSSDSTQNVLGGYLLNDVNYVDELVKHKIGTANNTIIKSDNVIISMVNGIMKTPYKINVDTLEYINLYGIEKKMILDDNDSELKLFISNPYGKYTNSKAKMLRSKLSKSILENNILSIAQIYSKMDKIYFPVRLDFRTRIYCRTDYFDYQKSDLAKGLILFARPGIIYKNNTIAINYLKAFGANMFGDGLDKKSLNSRVKWIDQHSDEILGFRSNDIVNRSENKTCFVSFCFEYERLHKFLNSKEDVMFKTYLPIQLDATCNGYQHLCLLTKEKDVLAKLNLSKSTFDNNLEDFYSFVFDQVLDVMHRDIDRLGSKINRSNEEDLLLKSLGKLLNLKFARSIIKKVIMRESYSAKIPSLVKCVTTHEDVVSSGIGASTIYKYKDIDIEFNRKDVSNYIQLFKSAVDTIAPKVKLLSKYLDTIVKICTTLNVPIPWVLPHGAVISQSYLEEKKRKVAAFSFTKSRYTLKTFVEGKFKLLKQTQSLRPNLIHSLDATTIALLYNNLPQGVDLYTVHDCFAVTANNIPHLTDKLKLVYLKLYSSNNYLSSFDSMLRITLNQTFGDNIFKLEGKFINLPDKNKFKKIAFPDVDSIINLDKSELVKTEFPDISKIVDDTVDISENISQSVYSIN